MDGPDVHPTNALVYHYTKAATALEHILESMTIRLGPIADTNDPWEARRNKMGFSSGYAPVPDFSAWDKVHDLVKRARVACFCRDDDGIATNPDALDFAPPWAGWSRDRMWAQYADGHRGVCIAFDRTKLVAAFSAALGDRGECLAQDVLYSDDVVDLSYDDDRLREVGGEAYAREYRRKHTQARYFTKRVDWAGEREFRLALLDDDPGGREALVRVHDALAYIVLGDRFARGYLPCIDAIIRRRKVAAYQLVYDAGNVYARSYVGSE